MQLNESTYETIFLLYIDNELSSKERLEVEAFIADNPSYALEMEAIKAAQLPPENIQYAFKENLKQLEQETSVEVLDQEWDATYATILKEDMQSISGLSTNFKNALKKAPASEGILIKPFGFSQNKFTYAAIAACLMLLIGYQQLTKAPKSDNQTAHSLVRNSNTVIVPNASTNISTASGEKIIRNLNQLADKIEPVTKTKKVTTIKLQSSSDSNRRASLKLQDESIAIAEPTRNNGILNNQAIITKSPSSYTSTKTIDAMPTETSSVDMDTEPKLDEKASTSYEVIDTEDPNRTIFIVNFEIDGNKLRGLKRKVTSLFKNNKSDRNK